MSIGVYTLTHGGGTFEAYTGKPVERTSGYAVAVAAGDAVTVTGDYIATDIDRAVAIVATRFQSAYGARGQRLLSLFIGTWIDGPRVTVDPVAIVDDLGEALRIARVNRQDAVYGFAERQSIPVPTLP